MTANPSPPTLGSLPSPGGSENLYFKYLVEELGMNIGEGHPLHEPVITEELLALAAENPRSDLDSWGVAIMTCSDDIDRAKVQISQYSFAIRGSLLRQAHSETMANMAVYWMNRRFVDRCAINAHSYEGAIHKLPLELEEIMARARAGTASPAERLIIRQALGMKNIELGRVSAAFIDAREQHVEPMRQAVAGAIRIMGGETTDSPREYTVVDSHKAEGHRVYLLTVKNPLAVLPDGIKIAERVTYVVESPIDLEPYDVEGVIEKAEKVGAVPISVISYAYRK